MNHVYLSPHLDDAVLSCGGAIHRHTMAGEPVLVISVFAGEAGEDRALSPFALEQHGYWGNPPKPMALRRAEDAAALTLLGATERHLDDLDAVYRASPDGRWLYTDVEALFGEVHPADPYRPDGGPERGKAMDLAERLANLIPSTEDVTVYAPLAVGHHVDHQIVHAAGRRLLARYDRLAFYEDYPHAENPGALEAALSIAGAKSWHLETLPLDAADLAAKVSASGYYRTQMAILFGGAEMMPSRVWTFAATRSPGTGLAERIWWPRW